jgi:hypothetical protein
VIRVRVGGEQAHRHAVVSVLLDATRTEGAGGVVVYQQGQQHRGRILFGTGAALVDFDLAQVQRGDGVHDEVNQVIGGHPVAQIGRQKQRGVAVNGNETRGHVSQTRLLRPRSKPETKSCAKSDRLLERLKK